MQTSGVDPDTIAARLWPGRQLRLEVLGGGITSRNIKVVVDGEEAYVLRTGGKDAELLGMDRRTEHEAALAAAQLGVGPEIVRFVEPEGVLVTRFVPGEPVVAAELREPSMIATVAHLLRRTHNSGELATPFDPFRLVEAYRAAAAARGVTVPAAYERASRIAGMIERLRPPHPQVSCHNHLRNSNVLADPDGRIWLLGWEYGGSGDRFFDLASLAVDHGFDERHDALLQSAYGVEDERSFVQMRYMSDVREAMWGVVQQAVSEVDYDFAGYADEHFERAERTADSDRFRRAML